MGEDDGEEKGASVTIFAVDKSKDGEDAGQAHCTAVAVTARASAKRKRRGRQDSRIQQDSLLGGILEGVLTLPNELFIELLCHWPEACYQPHY